MNPTTPPTTSPTRRRSAAVAPVAAWVVAAGLLVGACSGDDDDTGAGPTTPATVAPSTSGSTGVGAVVAGEPFPEDRCAANRAAGTVTYHTGFDYAATASIIEVLVAEGAGYYDALCLDVEIVPSFSVANYPLVAANDVQFASAGSFSEVAVYSADNDADLVAVTHDGHIPIETLLLKPGVASEPSELAGTTIGVKGALPSAVTAMLAAAGLTEGEDFQTVLLDGYDPVAHMAVGEIVGVPAWRSNEPGALTRAGVPFEELDPTDYGIPGSFGLIYTNREFLDAHPTAAEDFVRATLKGLADALADPDAAAQASFDLVEASGNPSFLSLEGETFRWNTDARIITETTPPDTFPGVPVVAEFEEQIAAYDAAGMYPAGAPSIEGRYSLLAADVYADDGTVIWPG